MNANECFLLGHGAPQGRPGGEPLVRLFSLFFLWALYFVNSLFDVRLARYS